MNFPGMVVDSGEVDLRGEAVAKVARVVSGRDSVVDSISVRLLGGVVVRFEGTFGGGIQVNTIL